MASAALRIKIDDGDAQPSHVQVRERPREVVDRDEEEVLDRAG